MRPPASRHRSRARRTGGRRLQAAAATVGIVLAAGAPALPATATDTPSPAGIPPYPQKVRLVEPDVPPGHLAPEWWNSNVRAVGVAGGTRLWLQRKGQEVAPVAQFSPGSRLLPEPDRRGPAPDPATTGLCRREILNAAEKYRALVVSAGRVEASATAWSGDLQGLAPAHRLRAAAEDYLVRLAAYRRAQAGGGQEQLEPLQRDLLAAHATTWRVFDATDKRVPGWSKVREFLSVATTLYASAGDGSRLGSQGAGFGGWYSSTAQQLGRKHGGACVRLAAYRALHASVVSTEPRLSASSQQLRKAFGAARREARHVAWIASRIPPLPPGLQPFVLDRTHDIEPHLAGHKINGGGTAREWRRSSLRANGEGRGKALWGASAIRTNLLVPRSGELPTSSGPDAVPDRLSSGFCRRSIIDLTAYLDRATTGLAATVTAARDQAGLLRQLGLPGSMRSPANDYHRALHRWKDAGQETSGTGTTDQLAADVHATYAATWAAFTSADPTWARTPVFVLSSLFARPGSGMLRWYDQAALVGGRCARTPDWRALTAHLKVAEAQLDALGRQLRTVLVDQIRPTASGTAWIASRVERLPPELDTSSERGEVGPSAPEEPADDTFLAELQTLADNWHNENWEGWDRPSGPAAPDSDVRCCPPV